MGQTIAEALREEGELRNSRRTLQMLLEEKFGSLPAELAQRIAMTTDAARLEACLRQVIHVRQLDELLL